MITLITSLQFHNFKGLIVWAQCNYVLEVPFSFNQVLVQETGERRLLGVGVVGNDYGNHAMPGWFNGTVGYHIDDGKIFDAENPTWGKEYEGEIIINKNS